jgi:hypothetical protein
MRICASYLKSRPNQPVFILPKIPHEPLIFLQCILWRRVRRFPPSLCVKTFSTRSIHLTGTQSTGWDELGAPKEAEKTAVGVKSSQGVEDGMETDVDTLRPPQAEIQNPDAWLLLLERFLPTQSIQPSVKPNYNPCGSNKRCGDILSLLVSSRAHSSTDLLAHLGLGHGRWQAALDIVNLLLHNVAAKVPADSAKMHLPGLSWPRSPSLDELCSAPIHVEQKRPTMKEDPAVWGQHSLDPRYLETMAKRQDGTMSEIWKILGYIIIEAADMEGEQADAAMRFVYRAIAQVHKFGLVPDNVYTYVPSNYTSSVVRPPIMHLLSSRILTTLSDAVWRAHQDDEIAQALRSGVGYKDLGHDPPGGRFRLKVRSLGPEVWLEFVLWCCVDGGFARAGMKIIENMRQRIEKPWFAVNWMLPSAYLSTTATTQSATVDWNRVQLRTGGAVGRIEGYSAEQPLAVMEARTISTEVVLALVDSLTNSLNVGVVNRGSSLKKVTKSIKSVISFLEPHRLPSGYLDHLVVRLHQSGSCDPDREPEDLQGLAETFLQMRSLETAEQRMNAADSFGLEAVAMHSELLNGLFHQSLEAFVNLGNIRRALDTFALIQQLVDSRKLQSIIAFLSNPRQQPQGYFSSKTVTGDRDFALSHGQLPLYKLAAFLDLVTDSKLVRLGNWLLYSEDVDGPLIPESAYATFCMSPALIRFAAVSEDHELTKKVFKASNHRPLFPSVMLFRALANAHITFSQYGLVHRVLRALTKSKVGGIRPENFASLAAGIMSLETRSIGHQRSIANIQVHEAHMLMHQLLEGFHNGNPAGYRGSQSALVRRQVGSLLRILECIPHTSLSKIARSWRSQFDSGNDVNLYVADFNIVFAAIVETKGATVGRTIWELFCDDPRAKFDKNRVEPGSYLIPGWIEDDENEWEHGHFLRRKDDLPMAVDGHRFLPIVEMDEPVLDKVGAVANEASISDGSYNEAEGQETLPIPDESISCDSRDSSNSALHDLEPATSDIEFLCPSIGSKATPNPIVIPDLRTLHFLVRGALNERRTRQSNGEDTSMQDEILEWSKPFFRAFGIRGKAIQEEIQIFTQEEDVSEHTRPSLVEEKRIYDVKRGRSTLREPSSVDIRGFFMSGKLGHGAQP